MKKVFVLCESLFRFLCLHVDSQLAAQRLRQCLSWRCSWTCSLVPLSRYRFVFTLTRLRVSALMAFLCCRSQIPCGRSSQHKDGYTRDLLTWNRLPKFHFEGRQWICCIVLSCVCHLFSSSATVSPSPPPLSLSLPLSLCLSSEFTCFFLPLSSSSVALNKFFEVDSNSLSLVCFVFSIHMTCVRGFSSFFLGHRTRNAPSLKS